MQNINYRTKQTSMNFHWLSKQCHISMELSRKWPAFHFDVVWNAIMWLGNWTTVFTAYRYISFLGGNEAKLCFKLAKHWGLWNKLRTLFQGHTKVALYETCFILKLHFQRCCLEFQILFKVLKMTSSFGVPSSFLAWKEGWKNQVKEAAILLLKLNALKTVIVKIKEILRKISFNLTR